MKEMREYIPFVSPDDVQSSRNCFEINAKRRDSEEYVAFDIIFVNGAYDSRKTGIEVGEYLSSANRIYTGEKFLCFTCSQLKSQRHEHFAIQVAISFREPFLL